MPVGGYAQPPARFESFPNKRSGSPWKSLRNAKWLAARACLLHTRFTIYFTPFV